MPREIKSSLIEENTIKRLKKFKILKNLSLNELRILLGTKESEYHNRIAKLVSYDAKETVIKEGDFDSWIFWVVQGEFAVIKNDVLITVFTEPGDVFGEMSSLGEDSRSATVIARKEGTCVSIDMSILDSIRDLHVKEKIQTGIYQLKSERLNQTTAKLVSEKQKMLEQQKKLLIEHLKIIEKEDQLAKWEKDLRHREESLEMKIGHKAAPEPPLFLKKGTGKSPNPQ
ncbi:MAG: cyclic nucleotide-binding domain-containing protein [Proteobacteria bacterium]|nr:cyclic nucleotide-binding domain-containing protein [Pseudomonadota bacterium]